MANKTVLFFFLLPTLLALSLFSFLACENPVGGGGGGGGSSHPFKAGLGPLVDTRPPTIYLESPDPGEFLPGKYSETTVVNFRGWAEDENEVKAVYLKVTSVQYPDENFLSSYTRVNLVKGNDSQGRIIWLWDLNIDTLRFPNGEFKIKLRVDDGVWPSVETNEITFFINNAPPSITVTSPRIKEGKEPGDVGSDYLNYGTRLGDWPSFPFDRQKSKENFLSGLIRDNEGIYSGIYDEAAGRYPPQIRFWPIKLNNGFTSSYPAGTLPDLSDYPWKNIKGLLDDGGNVIGQIIPAGVQGYAFSYRLPKEPGFYGFEIRAQNSTGRTNAHYPRSYYPANYGFTANAVNSYVILYVSPENEVPKVELYRLEDLEAFWSGGALNYTDLAGITDNEPHPYINANNVNKRGPFTLRVKAWHTEGIKTAAVYWVNEDTGERGRFIWDTATPEKASDEGWTAAKGVSAGNNYTEWGYGEPDNKIRSFIFTYNHNLSDDRVPTAGVNPLVSGATKVQLFTGTNDAWETLRIKNELAQEDFKGSWADMTGNLKDGVYNLEIFATGGSSDMNTPFTCSFRLDTVAPTVVITGVDGAYDIEEVINPGPGGGRIAQYTVNGVVQPKMRFTDEDSRLRRAGPDYDSMYFNQGENEQFFVLVGNAQRTDFDGYIQTGTNNKWWWPITAGTTLTMPLGVVPIKNGKILRENNAFKIKTSPIYTNGISGKTDTTASSLDDPVDADIALPDGTYWLYVFCRDNAFNVGHESIPLKIEKETDRPVIDLSIGVIDEDVQDPNVEADNTPWGFVLNGQTRNKITENNSIVLNIKDDDSLGFGGSNSSKTEIKFTRAVYSGDRIDYSDDNADNIFLSQDQIETVFGGPMSLSSGDAAIKARRGVITQEILTDAIRSKGKATDWELPPNSKILPDGMYRFTITVEDYSNLKMKMDNPAPNPDPDKAAVFKSFWIVVDSAGPKWELDSDSATNDEYVPLENNDPAIKGKVSDKNGPVTIVSAKVYNIDGSPNTQISFNAGSLLGNGSLGPLVRDTSEPDKWLGNFFTIRDLNKQSGRFRFEIIAEDRFGNQSTLDLYLQVDNTPPKARINTKISTFERDYEDASTGLTDSALGATLNDRSVNRKRLANGVLNFNIGATDDGGKVYDVVWWLVNSDNPAVPTTAEYNNPSTYTSAVSYGRLSSSQYLPTPANPANTPDPDYNTSLSAMQYINTLSLYDGVYTLIVMAKDTAGNISYTDTAKTQIADDAKQTIYLLQEHDRPYFYPDDSKGGRLIAPDSPKVTSGTNAGSIIAADAAVRRNALVTGQITDDDGFFNTDNTAVRDGSVTIWVSTKDPLVSFNIDDPATWTDNDFESVTYKAPSSPFTGGLSRANPSVLNISVNLRNLFPNKFTTDGAKYYIIEVTDSGANKYAYSGPSSATKPDNSVPKTRSKLFGFMYDNNPPVINDPELQPPKYSGSQTYPVPYPDKNNGVKNFGPNAANDLATDDNFHLTGTISDANLKKITDPNNPSDTNLYYYFEYYLDTDSSARKKYILKSGEYTESPDDDGKRTTVRFNVKASDFCHKDNLNFDGIPSSNATHTLTLIAYDKSENTGYYSFNFIKDTKPPDLRIVVPANTKLLPLIDDPAITGGKRDWWYDVSGLPDTQQQKWYKSRHEWEMLEAGGVRVNKLPLISYSNGVPQLRVTFNDDTSNIKQTTLKYWIDGETAYRTATTPVIDINSANWGKTVNWTIDLTTTGGIPLADGVHSIRFSIEDAVGNILYEYDPLDENTDYGTSHGYRNLHYGFRIKSSLPTITVDPPPHLVYGAAATADTLFSIPGIIAEGANLQDAQLRIKYPDNSFGEWKELQAGDGEWFFTAPNMEKLTWKDYKITRGMLLSSGGVLRGGNYELELKAVDLEGKGSEPSFIWQFTIDTGGPTLVLNDFPADATLADTVPPADLIPNRWNGDNTRVKVFTSPSQRLQGLIKDEHSNLVNAQILIQRFDYSSGTWKDYYKKSGDTTGTWESAEQWNELLAIGEITREKIVEQPLNLDLSKIENITDGLYRARLRARDSAYINGTNTWDPAADGHPVYSYYYYFFYAPTVPEITGFTRKAGSSELDNRILFSAAVANGTLTFTGNAASNNGYKDMTVTIQRTGQADRNVTITAGKPEGAPWSPVWQWTAALPNFPQLPSDDGAYTLVFTVTDWAGRSSSSRRQITLDNTPPTGEFTAPELLPKTVLDLNVGGNAIFKFASDTFYGGEEAKIKGIAEDKNGLKGIWYHLGYTQNVAAGGNAIAPTKTQVIQTVLTTAADDIGGDENNDAFDTAAKATGADSSAWFKYTNDASYPQPIHFTIPASALLYEWELAVPVSGSNDLGTYTKDNFTLKGRQYNGGANNRTMAHRVNEASVPAAYRKTGLYSIPVWIRVADEAGNVSYFQRDIWVYPNGDYPTNAFINPSAKLTPQGDNNSSVMGGTISVDGMASDNVNVRNVIYRVRADNRQSSNDPNWDKAAPPMTNLIRPSSGATPFDGSGDQAYMLDLFTSGLPSGQQTVNYPMTAADSTGWYLATVEGSDSIAKSKAWSFYINANNEFTTKGANGYSPIENWGFKSSSTLAANDTIRVYVEVLVFDGKLGTNAYNFMSLGENAATTQATPDILVFYLSSSAPEITNRKLSNVGAVTSAMNNVPTDNASYTSGIREYESSEIIGKTRSGRFAVQMRMEGKGKTLKRVSVSLPSEAGQNGNIELAQYRPAWEVVSGVGENKNLPGIKFARVDAPGTFFTPPNNAGDFIMYYGFDTAIATAGSGAPFAPVMQGNWANSGGKYAIEVRLYDMSESVTSYRIEVGIDNFAPVADMKTVISNGKAAGTNQTFMGRAYDYWGTNSNAQPGYYSVEKVYAWFTKDPSGTANYVNLNTKGTSAPPPQLASIPAWGPANAREATFSPAGSETVSEIALVNTGTLAARSYPRPGTREITLGGRTETIETGTEWVKVISEAEAAVASNRMYWQPITAGRSILWSFIQDTTVLPDGPIYLNYIVVDSAGNASLYQQKMVIMNNYPRITDVTLYTDNIGQGAAFTKEGTSDYIVPASMPAGYLNTGFISKNRYIGFKVAASSGNGNLHYRIQYVKRTAVPLTNANLLAIAADAATAAASRSWSNIYAIKEKGNMGDAMWATLMGKPREMVTPEKGMHFAFKATALDIGTTSADTAEVWRYTLTDPVLKTERLNQAQGVAVDDQITGNFRFSGNDFDSNVLTPNPDRINEKLSSRPDKPDGAADPANPGAVNDPNDTAFFLIKVWDSVNPDAGDPATAGEDEQLYDAVAVGMNVYLSDHLNPTARLYDLNPYFVREVVGNNNEAATIRNAAEPTVIGDNIVRGGLFNTRTAREPVKSGYIDPRGGSLALKPMIQNEDGDWVIPNYPLLDPDDGPDGVITSNANNANDKVSGRVILRGLAWDDQLIDTVSIKIGGDTAKTILKLNTTTGKMEVCTAAADGGNAANAGRVFFVEQLHWKTGHVVEWAYVWDTEAEPASLNRGPGTVKVEVTVRDKNGPLSSVAVPSGSPATVPPDNYNADNANPAVFHSWINVDVVPYITGFERETPAFATKRSLQGWYSFYQGEKNIALRGYNFGQPSATVNVYLNSSGVEGAPISSATWNANPANVTNTQNRFSFTIPEDAAASGKLDVSVNGTRAYNHTSSHANKSWNREYNVFTPGSNLWINKPHAHIWRTNENNPTTDPRTYIGTVSGNGSSNGLDHPGMALEYSSGATLHGVWGVYGKANSVYGTNTNTGNLLYNATPGEPYGTPDISIFQGTGTPNVALVHQTDGRPRLVVKATVNQTADNNTPDWYTNMNTLAVNGNATNHDNYQAADGTTQRWQNVRISKALANGASDNNNVGRIYMTAFNADTKGLWYGSRYGGSATDNNTANTTFFIDGTRMNGTVNARYPDYIAEPSGNPPNGIPRTANAGEYNAVDYDNIGPIIAYYDNNTVRIAFGTTMNPNASEWNRRYLLPASHPLRTGSGQHISIKVDKDYGIHLAFYNSAKTTVVYYYAKDRSFINVQNPPTPGTGATANVRCHTIDNVITGGIRTDISIHEENGQMLPWIVYGDSSRTDNYDGVRVAYKSAAITSTSIGFTGTLTCPVTGADITGWEALSMPAQYMVKNDRLNIEAWPPTVRGGTLGANTAGWNAAVGYAGTSSAGVDMFRVGYFYYPKFKGYGNNKTD